MISLAAIYGGTLLLTELISHSAAVSLFFPDRAGNCRTAGDRLHAVRRRGDGGRLARASRLRFGYQTHMMVYSPGGYRFTDFLRIGIPMDLLCWAIAMITIPMVLPLVPG